MSPDNISEKVRGVGSWVVHKEYHPDSEEDHQSKIQRLDNIDREIMRVIPFIGSAEEQIRLNVRKREIWDSIPVPEYVFFNKWRLQIRPRFWFDIRG